MADAVIVSTARTPIGKAYRGAFNNTHGATLAGHVIASAVQRAGIERDRLKAIGELDRLRKSVQEGKKALTDLDDDARKAGVPPGWLR